ncbi:MAG TPA: hypothetical protein VMD97_10155 [Candidatus Aquilonibacter sp.]|nr:hypothetical protein [Candidatus Aquilonibacter sp.]
MAERHRLEGFDNELRFVIMAHKVALAFLLHVNSAIAKWCGSAPASLLECSLHPQARLL